MLQTSVLNVRAGRRGGSTAPFEDKQRPGVQLTAPAAGTVQAIHRGDRRACRSIVIELSRDEQEGRGAAAIRFESFSGRHPTGLSGVAVRELLLESGLWSAIWARPFDRVADPQARPHSVFVTAIDTEPLRLASRSCLRARRDRSSGLVALTRLTVGLVYVCTAPRGGVPLPTTEQFRHEEFAGVHPAGVPGLHIHRLDPTEDIEYYLCGPPIMLEACMDMLDALGVERENILHDDFG